MTNEYAPAGILYLFDLVKAKIPAAINAGIVGDEAHTYGYHRGRNYVGPDDYSVQLAADRQGSGDAACALDLSWSAASWQYTVSSRLLNAANDSRMAAARSFFGSADGVSVVGFDYAEGYPVTSDPSHLWHVHLSILRQYAEDRAALARVAEVITGGAVPPVPDEYLPLEAEAMLLQNESSKLGVLITGGKAILVRSAEDYTAMQDGGVPAAEVSGTLFNNVITAMGGASG